MASTYGAADPEAGVPPPAYGDKPPTYDEATDPNGPPPSYDSLYGEFRQIDSPRGFAFFLRKFLGVLIGTVIAAVLLGVMQIIPISMIVIGSMNLNNCPVENYIPLYLVVAGSVALFKALTNFYYRAKARREANTPEDNVTPNPFDGILNCFLLGWFIAGSVWVYRVENYVKMDVGDVGQHHYCNALTYLFAWWTITLTYIFVLLTCLFMCCCGCFALCFKAHDTEITVE